MASRYGQGSIHYDHAKGLWVGAVELEPGPDGRRRRKFVRVKAGPGRRPPKELIDKLRAVQTARDSGAPIVDELATVGGWLRHWAGEVVPTLDIAEGTADDYRWLTAKYLIPRLGRVRLAKLTVEHVEKMMAAMRADGLSPRTIAYTRAVLRLALTDAERRGRIPRNVVALTRAPKKSAAKLDDALTVDEAATVLQAASGDRLEALAVLVLAVGLRPGEAYRLRWPDLDFDNPDTATLTVNESKTAAGVRTIALPEFVATALRHHRRRQRDERMAAPVWGDPELVFTSTVGTRLDDRNALRWWHNLCEQAGIPRRRFYCTRHTAATLMLNNGVPLEVVSATLGHAGLAITADVYAKVRPELQRKAADTMESVLGAGAGKDRRR